MTHQSAIDVNTGTQLVRRARNYGSAGFTDVAGAWRWGMDLVVSGARFDSASNTPESRIGGYGLINLHGGYALSPEWTLSARVNNAGGKHYELAQGYNTPGRNFFVGLDFVSR